MFASRVEKKNVTSNKQTCYGWESLHSHSTPRVVTSRAHTGKVGVVHTRAHDKFVVQDPIHLTVYTPWPPGFPILRTQLDDFMNLVTELTNGYLTFEAAFGYTDSVAKARTEGQAYSYADDSGSINFFLVCISKHDVLPFFTIVDFQNE